MNLGQTVKSLLNLRSTIEPGKTLGRQVISLQQFAEWFSELMGGSIGKKIHVTPDSAMRHAAVYACVRLISENIATIPWNLYRRNENGRELATDHAMFNLVHSEPHPHYTSSTWFETIMAHISLWGNGYAKIERGEFISLKILLPWETVPRLQDGEVFYQNKGEMLNAADVLHFQGLSWNGMMGISPIAYQRENIGVGLSAQRFGLNYFENGTNAGGFLEIPGQLSDTQYKRQKESFNEKYQGLGKSHEVILLENGAKFNKVTIPPNDSQFIETRKFSVADIARIFRVPLHMIADLDRSTNNNIEQQSIEFVRNTLRPWVVKIEQELNRKLLLQSEKGQLYFEANLEGLLRGDAASRGELYKSLFSVSAITPNEIRQKENMNNLDNGDETYAPLNMIPTSKINEFYATKSE